MVNNKFFIRVNIFFLATVVLNVLLLMTGTQFWYDISPQYYEYYLWYADHVHFLAPVLLVLPFWSFYRLNAMRMPIPLLLIIWVPVLIFLTSIFGNLQSVFLPLIMYVLTYLGTIAYVLNQGWGTEVKKGSVELAFWYLWQAVYIFPGLFSFLIFALMGSIM